MIFKVGSKAYIENNYIFFDDCDDKKGVKELKFLMDSYEVQPRNKFITDKKWNEETSYEGDKKLIF